VRDVHDVLQRVAVCCSVLQCVAVCCSVLQCVAVCCSVLITMLAGAFALTSMAKTCSSGICVCEYERLGGISLSEFMTIR